MKKQQNTKVKESFWQRFREWWCQKFGCIKTGPHYGMPQASCRRCGHINKGIASEGVPEWSETWGPFFN